MRAQFRTGERGQIGGRDIEHGFAAGHAALVHPVDRSGERDQRARCKFRVGVEFQTVLDRMRVRTVETRLTRADDEAAVRQCRVVALHPSAVMNVTVVS